MRATAERTLFDLVLQAAATLPEEFGTSELVIAAWRHAPERFGLKGYHLIWPDSNRIIVTLCGVRGLPHAGLLDKVAPNRYRLSNQGRQRVAAMQRGVAVPPLVAKRLERAPTRLTDPQKLLLSRIFETPALDLWREGQRDGIRWADACALLDCGDLDAELPLIRQRLQGGGDAVLEDGRAVSVADVDAMLALVGWLRERFAKHLKVRAVGKGVACG